MCRHRPVAYAASTVTFADLFGDDPAAAARARAMLPANPPPTAPAADRRNGSRVNAGCRRIRPFPRPVAPLVPTATTGIVCPAVSKAVCEVGEIKVGKATITVNTSAVEKARIDQAARDAGMSTSAYMLSAARARMTRLAAARYRELLASDPDFAAQSGQAYQFALSSAAVLRAARDDAA